MIVFILIMLANGVDLRHPMILETREACEAMGQSLISDVQETKPDRAAALSFRCDTAINFAVKKP